MKRNVFFRVFLLIALGLTTFSCTSDDDGGVITNSNIAELEAVVINGKWGVALYSDSGEDKTSYFEGYDFIFNSNKLLLAEKDENAIDGTWSITKKNNDDNGEMYNDVKFNIYFPFPQNFSSLSDDWQVTTLSSSKIELMDISGGNREEGKLVFIKI